MELPHTPQALAAALPDVPRWIETRALLLSGNALLRVSHDGAGGVVTDTTFPAGGVIGRADPVLLEEVLADATHDFDLVVPMDAVQQAQAALPGWTTRQAIVHLRPRPCEPHEPPDPDVVVSVPPQGRWLEGLPEDVRTYAALAEAMAVRVVNGDSVAVCAASDVTEALWDVGIDTLEDHRRRGCAVACFHSLAAWMVAQGRQPVWSAYEAYLPSLALAAKLGFEPVDQIAVLSPDPEAFS